MARFLSTRDVARILDVSLGSVANWVDQGQLRAGKTPGGHRRVAVADLIDFLRRQKLPVPPELEPPPTRILVVDDEPATCRWLEAAVKAEFPDCEVLVAGDGYIAGEKVASLRPNVVILDMTMPGLDGFEVCRRIKANGATSDCEVIAITGDYTADRDRQIRECGARVCLAKPLVIDEIVKQVNAALNSHRPRLD